MWLAKLFSTVTFFDKPVFCEKHDSVKFKNMSREEMKQSEEIFCVLAYIRKRVMDPFYYSTEYSSAVLWTWFERLEKFNFEYFMSWEQLEKEMDLVQLIHDIATYTLASLTKVCVFCEKSSGNFTTWVSNTNEDTELWHNLKKEGVDFKKVLASSSQYQKILYEMYGHEQLSSEDYKLVDTTFFVTFMIRYAVFSSESGESILAGNKKIMEHTKKFTLEFPIGEDHIRILQELHKDLSTVKGDGKESFSSLLDLVMQATLSLKQKKYKEAEVYGYAIVALVPSWCKGYFYLATAIHHRGERVDFALNVAALGLQNCASVHCSTCETFQLCVQRWQQECSSVPEIPRADNKLPKEGHKMKISDIIKKKLSTEADDVPELTDPSSSNESSDSDSEYDAAQEEIVEVSPPVPKIKQVKGTVEICPPFPGEKQVKSDNLKQKEASELKQKSPEKKQKDSKENGLPLATQSPVKKKTISEQNEATKLAKEVDPKPPKNTPKKAEKARQRKESLDVTLSVMEIQEKIERFKILLKEGSAAVTDGCGLSAVRNFYDALSELKSNPNIYKLEEHEIVCLKYAYGSSCCKSGTYEDLNKAITIFNEILNDHQHMRFPVAYYGLGLAHFKLNRFKEALSHFEMLQSMIDKGIHYTVYGWPGTVNAIEETKIERLKVLLTDLVTKCRSPPSPAAICRHENCLSRSEIYYSDPDFKGFTIIQCQDRCLLQYHPPCWKALKDSLNRTDKDFLGQQCLTPDCEFVVMEIECIGKDGTSEKHFEIEDNEKLKKHKKSRLEKRLVMKEQKKRRRLESQCMPLSESTEVCDDNNNDDDDDEGLCENISNATDQPAVKEMEHNEVIGNEVSKKIESNLSANAKPFYVKNDGESVKDNVKATIYQKKDVESAYENEKISKKKERQKAKKPVALSLDEFSKKIQDFSYYSEYKMKLHRLQQNKSVVEDRQTEWSTICETEKIPHLDPNRPFYIPEDLRDDPLALDAVLQSYTFGKADYSRLLKEKIYMHLEKILSFYGPMRVDDPILLEEVSNLPPSFVQLISDAGGLKDFLLASMRFAFVGDHICIISDVVKAYSLASKSYNGEGYSSACDRLDDYELFSNGTADEDDFCGENSELQSRLNPHATEYNPLSPVLSKNSVASGNSSSSSEKYESDVDVKETEQGFTPTRISLVKLKKLIMRKGQCFDDSKGNNGSISDQPLPEADLGSKSETPADSSSFFTDLQKVFEYFADAARKLPNDKKLCMILKVLKFVLNDEYFAENITLFNQQLKPFAFTILPRKLSRCVQAGTPDVSMHSKAVMKEDEHIKTLIEDFCNLQRRQKEEQKIVEEKLEHLLDTVTQLQNALAVAEMDKEKKVEEIQTMLEEEKKEFKKKEKNWEKEQKRFELNQARISEQLKLSKEEIKNLKDELSKKDTQLKEVEDLKKATEVDLENESKAKSEVETSFHAALQYHEVEVSSFTKKLQDAQLEILTIKKTNFLEKIGVATKNAELRLKEIQDGLPLVTHPLILEQLKSLQSQIKEHIVKLGKIHCDFVKAADEQINELKKGKDLSDLQPLVEPVLSECPALFVPPNAGALPAQASINLAPGSSTTQAHPNLGDWNSLGLMMQTPNPNSVQPPGQIYNPFLNTVPLNQRINTHQGASSHGTSIIGNLPCGPNLPNLNPYPMENLNMMKSSSVFDSALHPNSTSGYPSKSASGFQPAISRAHVPPGLSVPAHSSSQGLPGSLPQASSIFHFPQTPQQNASATPAILQSPFSFGFPQLNRTAAAQVNDPERNGKISAAEAAFINALKKAGSESQTHSEKSVSKENISETKSNISNPASLDSVLLSVGKGGETDSARSSPMPVQSSRDTSNQSGSSLSVSVPVSEPCTVSKQSPTLVDVEATEVKFKPTGASTKQKKSGASSRSGASSVVSDCDSFNLNGSTPENSMLELGYTVKETEDAHKAIQVPSSSGASGFATAVKAPMAAPKNAHLGNKSYEKLLGKLVNAYPQHSRSELMDGVSEFRANNNNKLSNLKFGIIISGIGEILARRKSYLAHAPQKKKPQLQVVSLTKKAAPPLPSSYEKSGVCPWAKPEPQTKLAPWQGENSDNSCSICLEDMTNRCSVKKLDCGHRFHLLCLKEWLDKNSNCPICRIHVLLPEDYPSLT